MDEKSFLPQDLCICPQHPENVQRKHTEKQQRQDFKLANTPDVVHVEKGLCMLCNVSIYYASSYIL